MVAEVEKAHVLQASSLCELICPQRLLLAAVGMFLLES